MYCSSNRYFITHVYLKRYIQHKRYSFLYQHIFNMSNFMIILNWKLSWIANLFRSVAKCYCTSKQANKFPKYLEYITSNCQVNFLTRYAVLLCHIALLFLPSQCVSYCSTWEPVILTKNWKSSLFAFLYYKALLFYVVLLIMNIIFVLTRSEIWSIFSISMQSTISLNFLNKGKWNGCQLLKTFI